MKDIPCPTTREQRLARAEEISNLLIKRYGTGVIAICIYGSTARGEDAPYSDLEMAAVLNKNVEPFRHEFFLDGWKTEVELWTREQIIEHLEDRDLNWPIQGRQFVDILSLHDPSGFWEEVKSWAHTTVEKWDEILQEAMVGDFLESVGKYRNAKHCDDTVAMRWCAWSVTWDAIRIVGILNKIFFSSRNAAPKEAIRLPLLTPGLSEAVGLFSTGRLDDSQALDAAVEKMVRGILETCRERGTFLENTSLPLS